MEKMTRIFRITMVVILAVALLGGSALPPADELEQVRRYIRGIEFDYAGWILDALFGKMRTSSLPLPDYLDGEMQAGFVVNTLELVNQIQITRAAVEQVYSDPSIDDPRAAAAEWMQNLAMYEDVMRRAGPVTEAIIQSQINDVLTDSGLTLAGQSIPPVLYHVTPLPLALIVSPRDVIQQDANISLSVDLSIPEREELEEEVARGSGKSVLVVEIGGVGVYPTMVMSTSDLPYLVETVAHEWTHNYLTLRPLGLNYETSPQLRTMNETAASIAGKEIGQAVLRAFYPQLAPPPEAPAEPNPAGGDAPARPVPQEEPEVFDFRAEMHETRVTVDAMLAAGKVTEAEDYMEARRVFLWENGFRIRKLNQAYFAFHGAYADIPGGAAGEDPVGPAVRALRERSPSLAEFINTIAWMDSFEDLQGKLAAPGRD